MLVKRSFLKNAISEVLLGWGGVEGGMLTLLVLRTVYVATLQRSLGSLLRDMILRCLWGGVGGGMLTSPLADLSARLQRRPAIISGGSQCYRL